MSKKLIVILSIIGVIIIGTVGVGISALLNSNEKIGKLNNELNTYKSAKKSEDTNDTTVEDTNTEYNTVNSSKNGEDDTSKQSTTNNQKNNVKSQTTTSNSNISEYDKANQAIKEALSDKNWLKENNIYRGDNCELYFVKISDKNSLPAYLIRGNNLSSDSLDYVRLVTYTDGKVYISNNDNFDYVTITYDLGNDIVRMEEETDDGFGFDKGFVKYYKIENNGEFKLINEFIFKDREYVVSKKYGSSADEYFADIKNYDAKYNFSPIDIKLTNENIATYVK